MSGLGDSEIMVVGARGQIVLPEEIRKELAIKPKTKLAVYRKDDKLIVTKLCLPAVPSELDAVLRKKDGRKETSKKGS